jgi:hypothetical protein
MYRKSWLVQIDDRGRAFFPSLPNVRSSIDWEGYYGFS